MPSCNVRVICRFRPVNKREQDEAGKFDEAGFKLVFEDDCNMAVSNGKQTYNFSFDRIFAPDSSQVLSYILHKITIHHTLFSFIHIMTNTLLAGSL